MSLFGFGLLLIAAIALFAMRICYRAFRRSDFIIVSGFGRSFTINNPFPSREQTGYRMISAPCIQPVNGFLIEFANSGERTIQLTSEDIAPHSDASPFRALQGIDFETIRLRLRAMSSLNPIVNLKTEEGVIRFARRLSPGTMQNFEIRTIFAPKGNSILLEKLRCSTRATTE